MPWIFICIKVLGYTSCLFICVEVLGCTSCLFKGAYSEEYILQYSSEYIWSRIYSKILKNIYMVNIFLLKQT
jgi:hypothetical protein